jgi:hypothetical protein
MIAGGHSSSDLRTNSDVNDMHGAQGFQGLVYFSYLKYHQSEY